MAYLEGTKVVIVEDEFISASLLSDYLEELGCRVIGIASNKNEALDFYHRFSPELIMMDINLGHDSGIDIAREVLEIARVPIVYSTSYSEDVIIEAAMTTCPYGYVLKPYTRDVIKITCETALARFNLEERVVKAESRYRLASEIANLAVLEFNPSDESFEVKGGMTLIQSLFAQNPISESQFYSLFSPDELSEIKQSIRNQIPFNKRISVQQNEQCNYFDIQFDGVSISKGMVYIGAVTDVTKYQNQINELALSDTILKSMNDSVLIMDDNNSILKLNNSFLLLTGYPLAEVIGRKISDFFVNERTNDVKIVDCNSSSIRQDVKLKGADGELYSCMLSITHLADTGGTEKSVAIITDVTELKKTEQALASLAFKDTLTGCANRNYLKLKLSNEKEYLYPTALVFIDIDDFKFINDAYGHDVGDEVLVESARRLERHCREDDKVIRFGGDEFVVVSNEPGCDAEKLGNKLLQAFDTAISIGDFNLNVHVSIGIVSSEEKTDLTDLLKFADVAMYKAKNVGKNCVVCYEKTQSSEVEYRFFLEQGLREALENENLEVHYQPVFRPDGRMLTLEALCRWILPEHGAIPPDKFIPVAEETRLIHALGLFVFKESCIAKSLLNEKGYVDLTINVNVSALQLQRPTFREAILDYLASFELNASDFVLEVTESSLLSTSTRNVLKDLTNDGFTVAVDDFGVGFSNLGELKSSINNIVKFDKTLLPDRDSEQQKILTSAMFQACNGLNKKVVIEGIEDEYHHDYSVQNGAYGLQGYLYAKPMHFSEVIQWLHSGRDPLTNTNHKLGKYEKEAHE